MAIEIRETNVISAGPDHDVVQLYISDAARDDEAATFVLQIHAKMRPLKVPTLAHVQRDVMARAQDALTPILRDLARELQEAGYGLAVAPKNPQR